jgi:hypothetical protein
MIVTMVMGGLLTAISCWDLPWGPKGDCKWSI